MSESNRLRFQLSRFLILMEQYDEALGATDAALNSAGSGYRENAEYLKSYEAQINMVKNAWTEAVIAMRDGGLGDTMILGLKTGLELLKVLTSIIDTFGTFPTVISLGAIAISTFSSKTRGALVGIGSQLIELSTGFSRVSATSTATQASIAKTTQSMNVMSTSALRAKSSVDMLSASQAASSKSAGVLNGSVLTASGSVQRFGAASSAGATGATAFGMSLAATGVAVKGFVGSLMMASLPIAIFSGLAWAIGKVTGKITEQIQEQKELERSIEETMNTNVSAVTTNMQQVEALQGSYNRLTEEKEKAGDTDSWDTEKEQEYLQVQQELADLFPALVKEVDSKGQAHLKSAEAIEEEIERTKELANIEGGRALHSERDTYKESMKSLAMYQDRVKVAEHQMTRYQEKADKARTDSAKEAHLSKVDFYRAEMTHYETIVRGIENSTKQEMSNLSEIFMQVNEISGRVAEESQKIFDSIDISSKSADELAEIRKELDLFAKDRQKAFDTGDMEAFNAKTTELKNYLTDVLEMPKEDISEFITYFNALKMEIEEAEEKAQRTARAMEDLGLEMDDGAESADEFSEMLGAVTEEMKKATDEISSINSILEAYHENGELSNQQMLDLIEKYPDLIQFISDEARLIEELTEIRDENAKKAEQHLINQLMLNNEFYNNNLDLIQDFVNEQFKFYEGDLKQWSNLAQAKADVETELINSLSKQWGAYYNEVTKQFGISPERQVRSILSSTMIDPIMADPVNSKILKREMMGIAAANAKLKASADAWNSFALDKVSIDFKTLGTSADKAAGSIGNSSKSKKDNAKASEKAKKEAEKYNKEIERSIYVADTYRQAMELLSLEMTKVTNAKNNATKGSNEYRKALKAELELLEVELELIKERSESVQHQISTGNVAQTGVVKSSGSSTQATVWNYFKARGLDDSAVAGIMGNIQQESGFNPKSVNKSSGASGIFQWLGSRKTELQNYAKQVGKSWEDLNVQLEFAWKELNSSEKRALTSLQKSMSASQHASEFDRLFERSGRSQVAQRQSYANNFYGQFAGGAQSGNSIADYYLGNTFRFTSGFGKRNTGIPGASTNHQGIDLAASAGTDIKSLRSGKVIASYYHDAQGHVVRVQQDDGIVAQYQHMQSKSPVAIGQAVSAGQSIGKVGMTGTASGNHLHLEITQNGQKVDPKKYLDEQGKAITSSSQDLAQNAQDIDGLRSELIGLNKDELEIMEKIMRLNEEYVESHLARYDKLISGVDKSISKVDKTLIEHSETSDGYRDSLAERNKHMEYQQSLLHKEANYIREQLENDALSADMKERLREKLSELGLAWLDVRERIKETNMEIINSKRLQFDDIISGVDRTLEKIDLQLSLQDSNTSEYADTLYEKIKHEEYKQHVLEKDNKFLEEQLESGELTKDQEKSTREQISDNVLELLRIENSIKDAYEDFSGTRLNIHDENIGEIQDKIDFLSYSISLIKDDDIELNFRANIDMQDFYKQSVDAIDDAIYETIALRAEASDKGYSTELYDDRIADYIRDRRDVISTMTSQLDEMSSKVDELESEAYSKSSEALGKFLRESTQRIHKFTEAIEALDRKMTGLQESNFDEKIGLTGKQFSEARKRATAIIEEFNKVSQTVVYDEDQQESVKNHLEDLKRELGSVNGEIVEYVKSLEMLHFEKVVYGANRASAEIDRLSVKLSRNLELIEGGILSGTDIDFGIDSLVGNTLNLQDLIDDPISEKNTILEIQDIRDSSYGEQLVSAENFYEKMQVELEEYTKVSLKEQEEFEKKIQDLMKISSKKEQEIQEEKLKELLREGKLMDEAREKDLRDHYHKVQEDMLLAMQDYGRNYSDSWDSVLEVLDDKIARMQDKFDEIADMKMENAGIAPPDNRPDSRVESSINGYAHGTDKGGHQGGKAIISEMGRELLIFPNGDVSISGSDGAELVDLPRGTHVIPNEETERMLTRMGVPSYAKGTDFELVEMRRPDGSIRYVHPDFADEFEKEDGYTRIEYQEDKFGETQNEWGQSSITYDGETLDPHNLGDKGAIAEYQAQVDTAAGIALKALVDGDVSLVEEFRAKYGNANSVINNYSLEDLKDSFIGNSDQLDSVIDAGFVKTPGYETKREATNSIKSEIEDMLTRYAGGDKSLADEIYSKIGDLVDLDGGWYTDDLDLLAEGVIGGRSDFKPKENPLDSPNYWGGGGQPPPSGGGGGSASPDEEMEETFDAIDELDKLLSEKLLGYSDGFIEKYDLYNKEGSTHERDRAEAIKNISDMQDELDGLYSDLDDSIFDESKYLSLEAQIQKLSGEIVAQTEIQAERDYKFINEGHVDLAEQRQKIAQETKDELLAILNDEENPLTEDMQAIYRDEIMKLDEMIQSSLNDRRVLAKELFDYEQALHQKRVDEINYEKSLLENELALVESLYPDDIGKQSTILAKIAKQQTQITNSLIRQREELVDQQREFEAGSYEWNLREQQIKDINLQIGQSKVESENLNKQLESNADRIIDVIKRAYEKQRDIALAEFDSLMKGLDDRYRDQMKKIGDEEDERDYTRALQKEQKKQADIRRRLNILMLDDSHEAQAERVRLEEELDNITESIEEMQHKRSVELRKKALTEEYEAKKESLQKEKEEEEYHFNEILNNERYFAELREDIVNGNTENIKAKLGEFLYEFQDVNEMVAKDLKQSFQGVLNMIDELNRALDGLDVSNGFDIGEPSKPPSSGGSSGGENSSQGNKKNIENGLYNTRTKHFLSEKDVSSLPAEVLESWMSDRDVVGIQDGKAAKIHQTVGKTQSEVDALSRTVDEYEREFGVNFEDVNKKVQSITHVEALVNGRKQVIDYDSFNELFAEDGTIGNDDILAFYTNDGKRRTIDDLFDGTVEFRSGGYTGAWGDSGKLAVLHEKELVLNKEDTANLMETIRMMKNNFKIPEISLPNIETSSPINLSVNIDNMTGDKKDVDNVTSALMNNLRKLGL